MHDSGASILPRYLIYLSSGVAINTEMNFLDIDQVRAGISLIDFSGRKKVTIPRSEQLRALDVSNTGGFLQKVSNIFDKTRVPRLNSSMITPVGECWNVADILDVQLDREVKRGRC